MNSKHALEEKQNIITAYKEGKSVSLLVTETGIPRSTIYAWLASERTKTHDSNPHFTLREYRSLENKVNRLKGIIDILQKAPCTATAPLENRLQVLDDLHDQYSVHMLCDALRCAAMRCACRGALFIIICCAANEAVRGTINVGRNCVRKSKRSMTTAARSTALEKMPLF